MPSDESVELMAKSETQETPPPTPGTGGRLLKAVNQPIALLLIGSALFGSLSWLLEARRECVSQGRSFEELNNTLTTEIVERSSAILDALHQGEPPEKLAQLRGPSAPHIFREHSGQSLAGLIDSQEFLYNRIDGQHDLTRTGPATWDVYSGLISGAALDRDLQLLRRAIMSRVARTTDEEDNKLRLILANWHFNRPSAVRPIGGCGVRMLINRSFDF